MNIEPFDEQSLSYEALTDLLHRAYEKHRRDGLTFLAVDQTVEVTRERMRRYDGWVAWLEDKPVGFVSTIGPGTAPPGYPAPISAGSFAMLAVDASHQRAGLGVILLHHAEKVLRRAGATSVVIDTHDQAHGLIEWYERQGFTKAGRWKWSGNPHSSVVLAKEL